MSTTPRETALAWLRAQLNEMGGFRNATTRDTQFKQWRQNTLTVIQRIWPGITERSRRFKKVPFAPASNLADSREVRESFERGCAEAESLLSHWIQEIEEHGVRHEPAEKSQASTDVAEYAATLTLDHAPSSDEPGEHEDEVRTLDLDDAPAQPPAPPAAQMQGQPAASAHPPAPGHVPVSQPQAPAPEAPAAAPPRKVRKPAAAKSKTRLKDLLGLGHLSAAQGAADHSSTADGENLAAPPPAADTPFPGPPPVAVTPFPSPPPVADTPFPAPPPVADTATPVPTAFPAPPPVADASFPPTTGIPAASVFPAPPPGSDSQFPLPSNFPTGPFHTTSEATSEPMADAEDAVEDLEDPVAPDEHVFASREIDLDAHDGADAQSYESMVEKLENEKTTEPLVPPAASVPFPGPPPIPNVIPITPPEVATAPPVATPQRTPSSAFPALAPIAAEPQSESSEPLELDPASLLQVVSVDTPRSPAQDGSIGLVSDDIGPGRFSGRTAPVAALAAQLDHMDIPPIDRVALKRFLIDLALRLESDTCAWVDLRAAIITVMEYPQLARRALPALLPFLDRAA